MMLLRRIDEDQLAQASYLVGCQRTGEALVIDPHRDAARYRGIAEAEGLRIVAVTETHIHADFVSGARDLAAQTGARLYLSGAGPDEWRYAYAEDAGATLLHDGDMLTIGALRLAVLHTPGHTPEHLSFLLTDTAATDVPMGLFSGDFVFVGDVGRPDLLERAAGHAGTMTGAARELFAALRRFRALPEWVQLWPGHGAGSACGKQLGAVPQSTVGYELRSNPALADTDEAQFVTAILSGQPEPPAYFAAMKRINRLGPTPARALADPATLTADAAVVLHAADVALVDTRPAVEFRAGTLPGALNLPLDDAFLAWAGQLLTVGRPFALIVADEARARAIRLLRLIGLDDLVGTVAAAAVAEWGARHAAAPPIAPLEPLGLRRWPAERPRTLVDVRNADERADGLIAGSIHIPLAELPRRLAEVPRDGTVVVYCQGGKRSAIAAGVLAAAGYRDVCDLAGGFEAWRASS